MGSRPGWCVAAAGGGVTAIVLGLAGANGVVVSAFTRDPAFGLRTASALAALSLVLQFGLGPLAGAAAERRGPDRVVVGGGVLLGLGAAAAGILGPTAVGMAAWAVGLGTSAACVITPTMAAAAGWFDRHRAAALGGIAAANAAGVVIAAPVLEHLLVRHGPATALGWVGIVGGVSVALVGRLVRAGPRTLAGPPLRSVVVAALGSPALRRFYLAGVLGSAGALMTSTLLASYAIEVGWSASCAAMIVGVSAVTGTGGRLLVPILTRGRPAFDTYRLCLVSVGGVLVLWSLSSGRPGMLIVFAVGYGISGGGWAALTTVVLAVARSDGLGSLLGLVFTAPAVGAAVGLGLPGSSRRWRTASRTSARSQPSRFFCRRWCCVRFRWRCRRRVQGLGESNVEAPWCC